MHYFHYKFIRKHQTLKTASAVAAGIANKSFTILDFVKLIEEEQTRIGGRLTNYLAASSK